MGSVTHESLDVETALTIGVVDRGLGRGGGEAAPQQRDRHSSPAQRGTGVGPAGPARNLTN